MNDENYVQAITFLATITLIFIIGYAFSLTNSPIFLMLVGIMSFGYLLILLGLGYHKHTKRAIVYIFLGFILIILSLSGTCTIPHGPLFF